MKKCILFIVAVSLCLTTFVDASAQKAENQSIQVTDVNVVRTDAAVTLTFALQTGSKVTANNRSLIINPILRSAGGQFQLPPVVVQGIGASQADIRRTMASLNMDPNVTPFYTTNGRMLEYAATIPYQGWMRGAELVFNGINVAGKKATEVNIGLVADNLLNGPEQPAATNPYLARQTAPQASVAPRQQPAPTPLFQQPQPAAPRASYQAPAQTQYAVAIPPQQPPRTDPAPRLRTTGDELAARFSFVEPISAFERARRTTEEYLFDYNMPLTLGTGVMQKQNEVERFVDMTRQGALYIQFSQGSSTINRSLANNNRMLVDLVSTIRAIEVSADAKVSQVVIVGFSAPDGTMSENEKLAQDRANVAKEFLTANTNLRPEAINVYNGSIDWSLLREQVAASNMPDKYQILNIIDNTPVWDPSRNQGRLGELMQLNGGDPYRYMVHNFFPQLRQVGAYVKVYYENIR